MNSSEFEQVIANDLNGMEAYLVYSDLLQGQRNPRGELIAI